MPTRTGAPVSAAAVTVASVLKATTHYKVLKVPPATFKKPKAKAVVAAAFKKASLRVHPDKSSDPRAEEAFIKLREAYRVLADPAFRAAYEDEIASCARTKVASTSAQQAAREAMHMEAIRAHLERDLQQGRDASELQQREEAERARARASSQSKKDAMQVAEAESRVALAERRVRAAKKRLKKQQQKLAAARETHKGAFGAGATGAIDVAEKAVAAAAREMTAAAAAASAASAAADKLALAGGAGAGRAAGRACATNLGSAPPLPTEGSAAAARASASAAADDSLDDASAGRFRLGATLLDAAPAAAAGENAEHQAALHRSVASSVSATRLARQAGRHRARTTTATAPKAVVSSLVVVSGAKLLPPPPPPAGEGGDGGQAKLAADSGVEEPLETPAAWMAVLPWFLQRTEYVEVGTQ